MKKVYTDKDLDRRRRRKPSRLAKLNIRNWRLWVAGVVLLLVLLFFVSCLLSAADGNIGSSVSETTRQIKAPTGSKAAAPGVWANAAVLMDAESGRVRYDKNGDAKLPIASTTKMVTALVVREKTKLSDKVLISKAAADVGEESIGRTPGETLSVDQLLHAMLIQSANDAAYALAEHTGGSIKAFSDLMNKKAAELGATSSHFVNPHGLDAPGHYSTARDLATIGRAVMADPVLAKIVVTKTYSIPWPGHPGPRVAVGHNEILTQYTAANGIKTGYTVPAGWCLVASASKDGKSLIASVLNSSHRAADAIAMFNYGFNNTARIVFATAGQKLGDSRISSFPRRSVPVVSKTTMAALTFVGSTDVFQVRVSMQKKAGRSVKAGEQLGKIEASLNNSPLENGQAVAKTSKGHPNVLAGFVAFIWYSFCWTGKIIAAPFRIF